MLLYEKKHADQIAQEKSDQVLKLGENLSKARKYEKNLKLKIIGFTSEIRNLTNRKKSLKNENEENVQEIERLRRKIQKAKERL